MQNRAFFGGDSSRREEGREEIRKFERSLSRKFAYPATGDSLALGTTCARARRLRIYGNYGTNEFRVSAKSRATVVYLPRAERYLFLPSFTIFIYRAVTTY